MQTSDLNVNKTESDHATAIFRQFQDAIFSREHISVKTSTKILFDLLQWQEIATLSLPKKLPSLLSSQQHFTGIFASEPMTLPEIDHGEGRTVQTDPTLLRYASAITEQKKCWELLAEKFDRFQTLHNNTQQHPTTCNRVCKRTQHVTSNNVGSCWPTMLRPFARGFSLLSEASRKQRNYDVNQGTHDFR